MLPLLEDRRSFFLTPPAVGALLGLVIGLSDAVLIEENFGNARAGMTYMPPTAWAGVIWTSVTIGMVVGLLFASTRLGRFRGVFLGVTLPGMLLLSRGMTPFRESTHWSNLLLLLAWLIATLLISIPLAFIPFRPVRRSVASSWALVAAISVTSLALTGLDPPLPRWHTSAARQPPKRTAPNVALIFLDTVRYDDALGHAAAMPELARFSESAIDFENAWAPAPWTVPSHLAVLTGNDPWAARATSTLAERLRSRDFDTAAISANPLLGRPDFFPGYSTFVYSQAAGVCRSALGHLLTRSQAYGGPRLPFCGYLSASEVTSRALAFVQSARRPYFLTLNYMDAHYPYYVPSGCHDLDTGLKRQERETFHHLRAVTPSDRALMQRVHRQYRAALACADRSLAKLLPALDDDNTVIVVAGDHGEQFGEHGLIEHGNSVYRQVLHVPLVVKLPHTSPSRIPSAVSLTDLYATILETTDPRYQSTLTMFDQGRQRPALASYNAWTPTGAGSGVSAAAGSFHYIGWANGREALFNDAMDAEETSPLPASNATDPARRLRFLAQHAKTRAASVEFRALGYLQ